MFLIFNNCNMERFFLECYDLKNEYYIYILY